MDSIHIKKVALGSTVKYFVLADYTSLGERKSYRVTDTFSGNQLKEFDKFCQAQNVKVVFV